VADAKAEAKAGAKKSEGSDGAVTAAEPAKSKPNPLAGIVAILGNKVTFIVSLVVIEVIVAYFVVTALIEPRLAHDPVAAAEEKKEKAKEKEVELPLVSLDDIVVNLNGSDGSRYLAAGVTMELDPGKAKLTEEQLKEKAPMLKHAVITVLSAKSVAEVSTMEGRDLIRREIQEHADEAIEPLKVHAVYFTEFVVQ
jgi:flagellar FliL protein